MKSFRKLWRHEPTDMVLIDFPREWTVWPHFLVSHSFFAAAIDIMYTKHHGWAINHWMRRALTVSVWFQFIHKTRILIYRIFINLKLRIKWDILCKLSLLWIIHSATTNVTLSQPCFSTPHRHGVNILKIMNCSGFVFQSKKNTWPFYIVFGCYKFHS